jgi:hypothetical protein
MSPKKKWTPADQRRLEQRLEKKGYTKADARKARAASVKFKGSSEGAHTPAHKMTPWMTQTKLSFAPKTKAAPAAETEGAPATAPVPSAEAAAPAPTGPVI